MRESEKATTQKRATGELFPWLCKRETVIRRAINSVNKKKNRKERTTGGRKVRQGSNLKELACYHHLFVFFLLFILLGRGLLPCLEAGLSLLSLLLLPLLLLHLPPLLLLLLTLLLVFSPAVVPLLASPLYGMHYACEPAFVISRIRSNVTLA